MIFSERKTLGGVPMVVKRIATSDYPTPAQRAANSRLDSSRLADIHGVRLPSWRGALTTCVRRLLTSQQTG